jgi:hypothetical protein
MRFLVAIPFLSLMGCSSPATHPGAASFGTRAAKTVGHLASDGLGLIDRYVSASAFLSINISSVTGPYTVALFPLTWQVPMIMPAEAK